MVVEVPCSAVGSVPLFSWPLEEHGGPPSAEGIAPTASVPPFAFGVKGPGLPETRRPVGGWLEVGKLSDQVLPGGHGAFWPVLLLD